MTKQLVFLSQRAYAQADCKVCSGSGEIFLGNDWVDCGMTSYPVPEYDMCECVRFINWKQYEGYTRGYCHKCKSHLCICEDSDNPLDGFYKLLME